MAYSPPQRYRAPNGASVMLPPEVAGSIIGLEPDVPDPPPLPDPGAITPSIPTPPPGLAPDAGLMAPLAPSTASLPELSPAPIVPQQSAPSQQQAPRPLTENDLRAGGYASLLEQQQHAAQLERDAAVVQIAADKRAAETEGQALAASGEREEAREAERANIQQRTMADIAQRSAAIDSEIDRIANTKIDTSMRQPVLAAIGLAMGAIGQALAGKTDGSNPALDIMIKQRDASVQRQMADRDAAMRTVGLRRDQIGGLRQKLTDTNALYDGLAAAETRRMRNEIARVAASSKSDATLAGLAKIDAGLATEEARLVGAAKDKQFALDDREKQRKEQERANRVGESQRWAGIADQRADRAERRYQFSETMKFNREKEGNDLAAQAMKLAAAGKADEANLLRARGIGGAREVVRDADGKIVTEPDGTPQVRYSALKNRDGSNFIPQGTEASVDKLRNQKAAADTLVGIIDEVQSLGLEYLSDTANSDKLQTLKGLWAAAKLETKDYKELGVIAGPDLSLIEDFLGTGDPTKWRNKGAGIAQARKNILAGVNTKLRAAGFDGEYRPPDLSKLRPAKAPQDEQAKDVLRSPWQIDASRVEGELGGAQGRTLRPMEVADKLREAGGMLPSQRAQLDNFAKAATSADPKIRTVGLEWLGKAANTAQAPAVRKYAAELLQANADRVTSETPLPREPLSERVR